MKNGFKAVQIGGPSGGCLTEEHLDLPLAYDSLRASARWWAPAAWWR
jgi:NADH-quinone oxidoreductase subunit F